jgi:hypothetical protein
LNAHAPLQHPRGHSSAALTQPLHLQVASSAFNDCLLVGLLAQPLFGDSLYLQASQMLSPLLLAGAPLRHCMPLHNAFCPLCAPAECAQPCITSLLQRFWQLGRMHISASCPVVHNHKSVHSTCRCTAWLDRQHRHSMWQYAGTATGKLTLVRVGARACCAAEMHESGCERATPRCSCQA